MEEINMADILKTLIIAVQDMVSDSDRKVTINALLMKIMNGNRKTFLYVKYINVDEICLEKLLRFIILENFPIMLMYRYWYL